MSKRKSTKLDQWVIKKPKEKSECDPPPSITALVQGQQDADSVPELELVKSNEISSQVKGQQDASIGPEYELVKSRKIFNPVKDSSERKIAELPRRASHKTKDDEVTLSTAEIGQKTGDQTLISTEVDAGKRTEFSPQTETENKTKMKKMQQVKSQKLKSNKLQPSMAVLAANERTRPSASVHKKTDKIFPSTASKETTDDLPPPMAATIGVDKIPPKLATTKKTLELPPLMETVNETDDLPAPMVTKTRSYNFVKGWLTEFPWCKLNEERTKLFCQTCQNAYQRKFFSQSKDIELRFISEGYSNWKDAKKKLNIHGNSKQHLDAQTKLDAQKKQPIAPIMVDNLKKSQLDARTALRAIITSLRYVTQQGLAVRGHDHQDGNFKKLLQLRSNDIPELHRWLRTNSTYTSMDCQNEIIRIISCKAQREILQVIRQRNEFCLIVDETSDLSGKEQVSMCVRTVDEDLLPQENFLGLYEVGSTTGEDLTNVIFDFLQRSGLSIQNLRGQCYDGAKNMSGVHKGVARRIADKQPLAVFVHCYAHSLNLAIQDTVKKVPLIRDTLAVVHEISTIVKASPKRLAQFKDITSQQDNNTRLVPKPLCPTRFIHRVRSIRAILENYDGLLEQLELLGSGHEQISSSANGLFVQLLRGEVYFTMILCLELFKYLETLSRQIQQPTTTLSGILEAVNLVQKTLAGHSEEEELFLSAFQKMQTKIKESSLEEPKLPRRRKYTPKIQKDQTPVHETAEEFLRSIYKSAYKLANDELHFRFSQTGVSRYVKMEHMILNPGDPNSEEILELCQMYSLNSEKLETNLKTLKFSGEQFQSLGDVVKYIKGLQPQSRALFSEVMKVLKLLLLFPVSSCTAERSFSVMKLVKTHLRTTMSQERLNHCVLIHTYSDLVGGFNVDEIMREFVNKESRLLVFGEV